MSSKRNLTNFAGLSLAIFLLTVILTVWDRSVFVKYLGSLNPIQGILIVMFSGVLSIRYLEKSGRRVMLNPFGFEGFRASTLFSMCFGAIAILIDFTGIFPDSINLGYPQCLLFYPVMGYIVEIVFHLLPISLLSLVKPGDTRLLYLIALFEPVFQVAIGGVDRTILWACLLVSAHIFLINLTQLYVFKKYGFLSMYWLRFGYYFIWHEVWGVLRLNLLF